MSGLQETVMIVVIATGVVFFSLSLLIIALGILRSLIGLRKSFRETDDSAESGPLQDQVSNVPILEPSPAPLPSQSEETPEYRELQEVAMLGAILAFELDQMVSVPARKLLLTVANSEMWLNFGRQRLLGSQGSTKGSWR